MEENNLIINDRVLKTFKHTCMLYLEKKINSNKYEIVFIHSDLIADINSHELKVYLYVDKDVFKMFPKEEIQSAEKMLQELLVWYENRYGLNNGLKEQNTLYTLKKIEFKILIKHKSAKIDELRKLLLNLEIKINEEIGKSTINACLNMIIQVKKLFMIN